MAVFLGAVSVGLRETLAAFRGTRCCSLATTVSRRFLETPADQRAVAFGNPHLGCAETHVANKVAQALGRTFLVYDASKAMFEDVLGYPNVEKLKHGVLEFVAGFELADPQTHVAAPFNGQVPGMRLRHCVVAQLSQDLIDLFARVPSQKRTFQSGATLR